MRRYQRHKERFGAANCPETCHVRFELPVPLVVRAGGKKTVFHNFADVVSAIRKQNKHECFEACHSACHCVSLQEHLQLFISVELNANCNLSPATGCDQQLIVRGKFRPSQFEALLRRYMKEFVESPCVAGSFDTRLERDPQTKLTSVVCNKTGSRRVVAPLRRLPHVSTKECR